jgi:membrane protein DedA with SNARE-associated domain
MRLMAFVEQLFADYGYLVLLIGLPLDFIALPIPPGNSTLTYTGYLSFKGLLHGGVAFVLAYIGAIIGFSITYLIGYRLGQPLIERYGKWIFLKPAHVEKTRRYYDKYGDQLLFACFFLPGIRQFIGYFMGIIRVPFRRVILYAYPGLVIWVTGFFSIGYFFGEQWQYIFMLVEKYLKYIALGLLGVLLVLLILKLRDYFKSRRA